MCSFSRGRTSRRGSSHQGPPRPYALDGLRRSLVTLIAATIALPASATVLAQGPTYRLGTTPSAEEIKARDTAVSPQGKELPPGSGTVEQGAAVYAQKCQACHGPNGTGTRLHRGLIPLGNAKPVKIQGSLVPYATTVWDFINRAMPSTKPGSLTPNEVYAATAFVLFLNDVIKETDSLDATTLPKVRMPNRDNFLPVEIDWTPGQRRPLGHYPGK
jgi:S-disulfanyl-L-cysteine oxidoreductase SoxD